MSVKIVTDSSCDISQEEARELGVRIIPIKIRFGTEEYTDGVTLSHRGFFEKLIETDTLPQTSQITSYEFSEVFRELGENGDEIICIPISSKLSGTYQNAVMAAAEAREKVTVIDSENVCVGLRLLIWRAAALRDAGLGAAEIAAQLESEKRNIHVIALLDTLEYLKKGGRISAATAFAGGVLGIKPVIEITGGEVALLGKARGSRAGNNRLNEKVAEAGGIDFSMPLCLTYSGLNDELLQKYIADSEALYKGKVEKLPISSVGCTIGVHVGPGLVGIAFFAAKDKD